MPAFTDLTSSYLDGLLTYFANPALAPNPAKLAVSQAPPKYPDGTVGAPVRYWSGYGMQPAIIGPPWSTLTAYDLNTGTLKWQVPLGNAPQAASLRLKNTGVMMPRNGPVITAGGVIFVATKDEGKLHAYDEETGKEIWQTDLPAASEGVPSVYEVNGREFLVICATSPKASTIPVDGPTDTGNTPVNRSYIAFALSSGATLETAGPVQAPKQ